MNTQLFMCDGIRRNFVYLHICVYYLMSVLFCATEVAGETEDVLRSEPPGVTAPQQHHTPGRRGRKPKPKPVTPTPEPTAEPTKSLPPVPEPPQPPVAEPAPEPIESESGSLPESPRKLTDEASIRKIIDSCVKADKIPPVPSLVQLGRVSLHFAISFHSISSQMYK